MEKQADQLSERFLLFASNIVKLVKRIDSNQFHRHIGMQLFRSATAIGANYEEARGAESRQDFAHKLQIVLKEARESYYWIKLIDRSEILKTKEIQDLAEENRQICDIIAKSIKTIKSNMKK
jgi:four helix bundle protein